MPAPQDLQGAWSWRKAFPIAFSVGIRPCTGAILLLIFAMSQGLLWAGILGTFAMALGTAITVSILAALAVYSRDFAERMSGEGSPWAYRIHTAAGFAGAALVFLLGASFFMASLKGAGPL
jgi:nickel/cobalt transporter (NicO) family protein